MTIERVYAVTGSTATPASPITLAEAGLKERSDLQEWVLAHPDILGPDVLVIGFEFDRWQAASGDRPLDRLDVLGIDSTGRLVIAELKRDRAPDTVEMQAIKYAAMASRFTEDDLVRTHQAFLSRDGAVVDDDTARDAIIGHVGELDAELLRQPRIILVAGAFPPVVTASVVWLTEMGLDITIQRVQAYRVQEGHVIVTVSQMFPIPDVEEFTISPLRADAKAAVERRKGTRERSTVARLIATKAIPDGTQLTLAATNEVMPEVAAQLEKWVELNPSRGRAVWHNNLAGPLEWEFDNARYRPSPIVTRLLEEGAGIHRTVRGPRWWRVPDGRDLTEVLAETSPSGFDWTPLHEILTRVPEGTWVTYGDLAEVVGTAAQPLGQHVNSCGSCVNAHRVLGADGRSVPNFRWSDPSDTRTQQDALEAEGLVFTAGRADDAKRLRAEHLSALLADAVVPT